MCNNDEKEGKDPVVSIESADLEQVRMTQMEEIEKARQERKRNREQQRRNGINDGIDRLLELVFAIDPELKLEAQERAQMNSSRGRIPSSEHCLLSRVEILNHGIMTLDRVHRENEEHKVILAHVMKGLTAGNGAAASLRPSLANPLIPNALDIQVSVWFIQYSYFVSASTFISHCKCTLFFP